MNTPCLGTTSPKRYCPERSNATPSGFHARAPGELTKLWWTSLGYAARVCSSNKHARFMLRMRLSLDCGCVTAATQGRLDNRFTVESPAHRSKLVMTAVRPFNELRPPIGGSARAENRHGY